MKEQREYERIKRYVDQGGNFKRICLELGISERTGRRKVAGYKKHGKEFFVHGNKGKKPSSYFAPEIRKEIIEISKDPLYEGCNFIHFLELLERRHPEIPKISLSTLRNIFKENNIISPKARRATKREYKKKMKELEKPSVSIAETTKPTEEALPLDKDPHPKREKSRYAGELVFTDASEHDWLEIGYNIHLHAAIEDTTGTVTGAHFERQELLIGYYEVMRQILTNYGIPYSMQTDGRSIFKYAAFKKPVPNKETYTQFAYSCKNLGIHLKTTSSAQAQGKIERLFGTFQSRLILELRIAGVKTIKEANEFLKTYIPQYNAQFASNHPHDIPNVFENKMSEEEVNLKLTIIDYRVINNGNCIRLHNDYYRLLNETGKQIYLRPKTKVLVIKALDGSLYATCKESIFALEKLNICKETSPDFDLITPKDTERIIRIPDMSHPWKNDVFRKYQKTLWDEIYNTNWDSSFPYEDILYTQANIYD